MAEKEILDRALYKRIKSMNKAEMSDFLNSMYKLGQDSISLEIDTDELRERLSAVKGIGTVRLNEIMDIILDVLGYEKEDK